ncbi:hypothetical protein GO988_17790 [Hymenobacter sp. HMF4947]|uniref:Periplasmic heavy metal sensor n=1 Tax=Hymenobacter ginkgonis TaxID=2682976 RepID=A0A7K1TIE7_9BACT|nr:hypothetical protein [Hymenobacter ginkgonis]MVN78184.1 hypothetical protein [Hymenobacter ginkgonis]
MKKSLILAALAFASVTTSFAQAPATTTTQLPTHSVLHRGKQHKTPEQSADHHTAMLTKKLSLTAEQQPKVRQILLAQAQEAQAIKAKYPAADQRQAMHQEMKAGRAKYQQQLQGVLTADQQGKLAALKQEHHKGEHGGKTKMKS